MSITVKLRYVHRDWDRHGNLRLYFRRRKGAPKVRIHEKPGTNEFLIRYAELLRESRPQRVRPSSAPTKRIVGSVTMRLVMAKCSAERRPAY